MLSKITQFAKKLLSRLANAVNQLFRRITDPARSNIVTGTLADLPRTRSELLAENACAGYMEHPRQSPPKSAGQHALTTT